MGRRRPRWQRLPRPVKQGAWTAIRAAIRHRFLRSVLTYMSTLRAVLGTGGASQPASRSMHPVLAN